MADVILTIPRELLDPVRVAALQGHEAAEEMLADDRNWGGRSEERKSVARLAECAALVDALPWTAATARVPASAEAAITLLTYFAGDAFHAAASGLPEPGFDAREARIGLRRMAWAVDVMEAVAASEAEYPGSGYAEAA